MALRRFQLFGDNLTQDHALSRLLSPRTIAVIGGKECERVVEQCDKLGFTGTIWPVHPTRDTLGGRACFKSVLDLPQAPDAAYVAVNRERTVDVVRDLAAIGAGGAVCYAAGFAEAESESEGSGDLQAALVNAAGDMPIIGPNCYGFVNALNGVALWPDQHGLTRCERGVAILTQSSNIAISMTMQTRGLPIAYAMTVGNQAQTGLSQIALGLLEDEQVTALGLHIEGLDDVKAFEHLALRARELGKPIVAIKVGKSEQAQAATMTHTASLAGSDAAHEALFKRLGIGRVHSIEAFLETLKLLHSGGPQSGNRLLSLSCSGGEASLMADAVHGKSVVYPPIPEAVREGVKRILGDIVTVANPLDYNTFIWGDWAAMEAMFTAALSADLDLAMLVLDFPRPDTCDTSDWDHALKAFVAAREKVGCRAAVVATMAENLPEDVAIKLMEAGITPLLGIDEAITASEVAAFIGGAWSRPEPMPLPTVGSSMNNEGQNETLTEHQSKQELAKAGLNVPKSCVIKPADEIGFKIAAMVSDGLPGMEADFETLVPAETPLNPPFALKALGVAHKSEMGAVKINLANREQILDTMGQMNGLASTFLLEEMAPKPVAELIIGVSRDPVVGLLITIGGGGVLTELLEDTVNLLLPASEQDIRDAVHSLRINKILNGYRGEDAADIDALVANILCIAQYAEINADTLEELDVNPLFACETGSIAVDALIVKRN